MIYLSNEPYPQEISVPRSFGVIVPQRNTYLSTADIATDLETDSDQKVLAASQGVALKAMVAAKADKSNTYTKAQVNSALALKADKSNTYTKAQVDEALAEKADVTDIPTKTSDLTNDSGFVTGQEVSQTYETKSDATAKETALQNAINTKQDILTFDNVPTNGSSNPVKSDGIYDALATKQPNISDLQTIRSGAAAGATAVQPAELQTELLQKQDRLISGTNIKTINNQSLLGSGNIDIQGGGGEPEIFWAEYGVTTYADVQAAYNSGKLCAVSYHNRTHILATGVGSNYILFGAVNSSAIYVVQVSSSDVWGSNSFAYEKITNRKTDIAANKDSNTYYPTTKAVYDALGKYGVISQTQTWTGGSSTGYTYTMSNQVWGLIPQANIDLYESAGAVFNETTGYFELNGLTDLSYEEMQVVFIRGTIPVSSEYLFYYQNGIRTNLPCNRRYLNFGQGWFARNSSLEVIALNNNNYNKITNATYFVYSAAYLKIVIGVIDVESSTGLSSTPFGYAYSLESIQVKGLKTNMSFEKSSRLSAASVAYMINNAGTATFTITLHATAYARATADADVQAALAAHTNVTLASN